MSRMLALIKIFIFRNKIFLLWWFCWAVVYFFYPLLTSHQPLLQVIHLICLTDSAITYLSISTIPLNLLFGLYTKETFIQIRTIFNIAVLLRMRNRLVFEWLSLNTLILFGSSLLFLNSIIFIFLEEILHIFDFDCSFLFGKITRLSTLRAF